MEKTTVEKMRQEIYSACKSCSQKIKLLDQIVGDTKDIAVASPKPLVSLKELTPAVERAAKAFSDPFTMNDLKEALGKKNVAINNEAMWRTVARLKTEKKILVIEERKGRAGHLYQYNKSALSSLPREANTAVNS